MDEFAPPKSSGLSVAVDLTDDYQPSALSSALLDGCRNTHLSYRDSLDCQ